jgi:serine/threonine-protein kinase
MTTPSNHPCPRCGTIVAHDRTHCGHCGQHQPDRDEPPEAWIGREIDRKYGIEEILGVGGMGMVFRARRTLVGDEIALKVLFPRFLESPLQRRLFHDEAVAAARLNHPNVVTVFDAEMNADGVAYIAMELLSGVPFKQVLRERAPMPPEEIVPMMAQVLDGLAAAHDANVIHRDLKPDNVFVTTKRDGSTQVKLVDFGIAAMLDADERDDEQRKLLGTLRYMAPEQCRGKRPDGRADLYAFGVMLYEGLTRKRATGKTVSAVINDPVRRPNEFLAPSLRLSDPLEALLLRLLAKDPDERPSTAVEVKAALEACVAEAAGRASIPTDRPPPAPDSLLFSGGDVSASSISAATHPPSAVSAVSQVSGQAGTPPPGPAAPAPPPEVSTGAEPGDSDAGGGPMRWLAVGLGILVAAGAALWLALGT